MRRQVGETKMIDCISSDCDQQAIVAVYWPGGPARAMCGPCMLRAARVASVMGFQLPVGDISVILEPMAQEVEKALKRPHRLCDYCCIGVTVPEECAGCAGRP